MANDVVAANATVVESVTPNYNKKTGEVVLALQIRCKTVEKEEGGSFTSVKVYKYLPAWDKEGRYLGKCGRLIDLHFIKEAFKGVPNDCEVHTVDDLQTGILYVKAKGVQSPREYRLRVNPEGDYEYPEAWINKPNCIVGFEPYVSSQDEFEYHAPAIEETNASQQLPDDINWEE